jgi:predicted transcriptional regulator of viral defense system
MTSIWIDSLHDRCFRERIVSMITTTSTTLPNTFTTGSARQLGFHPREIYALRDSGEIVELSRGVFRRSDAPLATYPDLLAVAYRAPTAIVCCVSAAVVYEMTDELPTSTQIAVGTRSHPPQIDYPPATVFRFSEATFELGLTQVEAAPDEYVRIYDPARVVVDLMRLRHRLGETLAYSILQRYLDRRDARPTLLLDYASTLDVLGPTRRALDIVLAE